MNQQTHNKLVLTGFALVFIVMFSGFFVMYNAFSESQMQLASSIQIQVSAKSAQIESQIETLQQNTQNERQLLEEQMLSNFGKLQENINKETGKVKLDLESQLKDVSTKFDEKSVELDDKISSLNVQSSDFSGIIDDVVRAAVSVKTNKASGSGVIYDKQGYIITNKHVIEDASSVSVIDYEGRRYPARIVASARNADLTILKIESVRSFDSLKFAKQSDIKVGSKVIAVGSPLGLSFTVTEGIISSNNRVIDGNVFIQTDVPINPGNSGGPLVNAGKKIVGINTFKFSDTEGLGFAIPSYVVEEIISQLAEESQN